MVLIDPQSSASYSGMVPGCVAGLYGSSETKIELLPLAGWAGIEFIQDYVVDMDTSNKTLTVSSGDIIPYDVTSIDIGSTTRGLDTIPGAKNYTIPTRPISELVEKIQAEEEQITSKVGAQTIEFVIIGAGAAGIELSLAIRARWGNLFKEKGRTDIKLNITVLDSGTHLLPNETEMNQKLVNDALAVRNILVLHNCSVKRVEKDFVVLNAEVEGEEPPVVPFTHSIWATGAACHPLAKKLHERGLECDDRGWVKVNPTLLSLNCNGVFAAGVRNGFYSTERLAKCTLMDGVYI